MASAPMSVPVQLASGQLPARPTRLKTPVASVGPPVPDCPAVCQYEGEVANIPACTVAGSPGRVTVPTLVQCVPSAES